MSEIARFKEYMMICADYRNPDLHQHLASHIILSLDGEMVWQVGEAHIHCKGICIGSDVMHTGNTYGNKVIAFLFTPMSHYAYAMKEKYLGEKSYAILDEEICNEVREIYKSDLLDAEKSSKILKICGLISTKSFHYDDRVNEILDYIQSMETVDHHIVDELCQLVCLSKSRLSHLFAKQTGMTLHSYIAFEKLRKTCKYIFEGENITSSCLKAGFDSSSHCSATCKRMFGIALSEVYKTLNKDSI